MGQLDVLSRRHRLSFLVIVGDGDEEWRQHELGRVVKGTDVVVKAGNFSVLLKIILNQAWFELELHEVTHVHPLETNFFNLALVFVEFSYRQVDRAVLQLHMLLLLVVFGAQQLLTIDLKNLAISAH